MPIYEYPQALFEIPSMPIVCRSVGLLSHSNFVQRNFEYEPLPITDSLIKAPIPTFSVFGFY